MIRRFWNWLKSLFRRRPKTILPSPLDEKLGARIKKRQKREGRAYVPTKFGPNMPKYQPCPKGHGLQKKRKRKTLGGAYYYCNNCRSDFFVKAK